MNEDFRDFDFVGKKLEDVKNIPNLKYRITMRDGVQYFGTCDYLPYRYNFAVDNGVITSVSMG
jgi:hypothetical protein